MNYSRGDLLGERRVDYSKFDDDTLLHLISRSHDAALSALYERYSRLIYSLALNSTGQSYMAEEVVQDVFIRVWERAGTYRTGQGKVVTWLASITRYRGIDLFRRQKVRPEGHQTSWVDVVVDGQERFETDSVEEMIELSDRKRQIHAAMAELPNEQKIALAYAYFQGFSHREIAELLGEPIGTIKTRIRLGMQKLRSKLQADEVEI